LIEYFFKGIEIGLGLFGICIGFGIGIGLFQYTKYLFNKVISK